jgi:uncharacterized membrane protein (UPF0127 family)
MIRSSFSFLAKIILSSLGLIMALSHEARSEAPRFETKSIILRPQNIRVVVEIADNDDKRQHGLMFRRELPKDRGMLFIFPDEALRHFWMKNTFIPLSLGFFDKNRKLIEIADLPPVKSEMQRDIPSYQSRRHAQYVLEVNQGWFKRHKIQAGEAYFEWIRP